MTFLRGMFRTGEQKRDLCISVVNLTKTLNTFNSERKMMTKLGCFGRFLTITGQLHDDVMIFLMDNDETFEAIGVKQSCVLVSTLCSVFDTLCKSETDLKINYKTDRNLNMTVYDIPPVRKTTVVRFFVTFDNGGVTICPKRTEIKHQPAPGKPHLTRFNC